MFPLLLTLTCLAGLPSPQDTTVRDLYPDTWVATDALGRTMPDFETVGPVRRDQRRVVGIFYITWHRDGLFGTKAPWSGDVARILAKDPAARLDGAHPLWQEGSYFWAEPECGYFLSRDEWVIRRDLSMLADAGVDVLVLDVTNAVRYWDEWSVLFPVMEAMRAEGNAVPRFCFWAFNGPVITVVQELYDRIYAERKHEELWFEWDGKPLLLFNAKPSVDANGGGVKNPNPHYDPAARTDPQHPHYGDPDWCSELYEDYTAEVKAFFTLRSMWWGYYEWAGERYVGTEDNWSFGLDLGDARVAKLAPEQLVSRHDGTLEEAAVTPAQHASSFVGKSWTREHGEPRLDERDLPAPTFVPWLGETVEDPEAYGIYFQERWDEALRANPQFLYLNDWNEWTAGKYPPPGGGTFRFMRRDSDYFFVDQYNQEFNRCISPMKGGYTDNYYMQMAQNIRRYKGVRPIPELRGVRAIEIDGEFEDWAGVEVEYRDTAGDTVHRDYHGYGGLHYVNDSGRNDILTAKVAVGEETVWFYAATREPLTPHTDPSWMLLLVDADGDSSTGWYGYDCLIDRSVPEARRTVLERWDAGEGVWETVARLDLAYAGRELELAVPRDLLGLEGDALRLDFHWCDNPADLETPISLCVNGDSAPNRRFNYRCVWRRWPGSGGGR